jgi:hypothetical protein
MALKTLSARLKNGLLTLTVREVLRRRARGRGA